ncbi:MAG TPA: amidohydrolase family protein, partial [Trueperaceae bacterium]|nr:amidohydrolase family protein [Trueperaceae bacterium]
GTGFVGGHCMSHVPPILDTHHHLWRYNDHDYDWMSADQGILKRDHLPEDLATVRAAAGVTETVAVQARRTLAETEWLLEEATNHPFILGVVGWFDFSSPRLEHDLERLAADQRLVGVRELIHDMPDRDYATSPAHVAGVRAAARHGLTYDLLLKPQHLEPATALVDLLPNQRFVVDHIAKPNIAGGAVEPWASDLAELARRDNVWCKVSGMVTEGDWSGQPDADFLPYFDVVMKAFGPSRVMVGSDWPVCTCARDYLGTMSLARWLTAGLSATEQERVLSQNGREFYSL